MTGSLLLRELDFVTSYLENWKSYQPQICIENAFIAITTHAKFQFNRLMLTLIFGIRASEPPRAWRTTEKAGPDRVNGSQVHFLTMSSAYAAVQSQH